MHRLELGRKTGFGRRNHRRSFGSGVTLSVEARMATLPVSRTSRRAAFNQGQAFRPAQTAAAMLPAGIFKRCRGSSPLILAVAPLPVWSRPLT